MIKNQIAVLGAGKMGAGIAYIAAKSGFDVIVRDLQVSVLHDVLSMSDVHLQQEVEKQMITVTEKGEIMSRIHITTDFSKIKNSELIIESVVENMAVKKQLFTELDNICSENAIFATNTASLSIAEIASVTRKRNRIIGIHFHNPVLEINLVEIVRSLETSEETLERVKAFVNKLGKQYVILNNESPGYIVNRILLTYINEAISCYFENTASKEDIDNSMKIAANMPIGPLELADQIGLDFVYNELFALYSEFRHPKHFPHHKLHTMVRAGHWGKKTGQGFYKYD